MLRAGRPRTIRNTLILAALLSAAAGLWLGAVLGRFPAALWLLRVAVLLLATTLLYSLFHVTKR
jgi:hypothetical protein